jgi:hypothetical protein
VWWSRSNLHIEPNGWNTIAANVSAPTPKARVYVTWVDMSDNTVHPVSGGQVTNYYSGGSTSVSTDDRGIANFALRTNGNGQNYVLAQFAVPDGSIFTSGEEFVNTTLNKFAVLNLAVSAPSISCTVIKSDGTYFEPLFQVTAFNEGDQLKTSVTLTPYYNLSINYSPSVVDYPDLNASTVARWDVTALVSYWILNDTSNNRLVLYTHENITYDWQFCEYSPQINSPTLANYANVSQPYHPFLIGYEPWVVNLASYPYDLLYIAEYGDGGYIDVEGYYEGYYQTFDGAYELGNLTAINSTVNGMEIVGLYVVGYALIDDAVNYLLDQGAACLYQLYDAYAPDGPRLDQVQGFTSGNHPGNDSISFSLHGHSCVYATSYVADFPARPFDPSSYVALASTLVYGSNMGNCCGYYENISSLYVEARAWLVLFAQDYPALEFFDFDQYSYTLLERQVCCRAALDQIANNIMSAAIDPTWFMSKNDYTDWNWTSWYDKIVRLNFYDSEESAYSSLCIDNYEESLYMGTVQGYIQGLEQGSIRQNCTFIDIRAYPISVAGPNPDGSFNYTRTITYRTLDGKTFNVSKTWIAFLSMRSAKIVVSVLTAGVPCIEVVKLTLNVGIEGGDIFCFYKGTIRMISPAMYSKIGWTFAVLGTVVDAATGDWLGVGIDAVSALFQWQWLTSKVVSALSLNEVTVMGVGLVNVLGAIGIAIGVGYLLYEITFAKTGNQLLSFAVGSAAFIITLIIILLLL